MPMTRLEFSGNVRQGWDPKAMLLTMHHEMVSLIKTDLCTCKSAIICHDEFVIGDSGEKNAFVFLTIDILPGRDQALKERLGKALLAQLKQTLLPLDAGMDIQYRVYVRETDSTLYFS
jgi:5-carboxymethyl-2-hydroxymuconate isomerase